MCVHPDRRELSGSSPLSKIFLRTVNHVYALACETSDEKSSSPSQYFIRAVASVGSSGCERS